MTKVEDDIKEVKEHTKALASELGNLAIKYSKLKAKNKRFRNALAFYAENSPHSDTVKKDNGAKARKALQEASDV
jgi:hypothetical protein